jgi:hypothetical protein
MLALHAQIDLDVAQRFSGGKLSKRQSEELIEAREVFDFVLSEPSQDHPADEIRLACPKSGKRFKSWTREKSDLFKSWGYVKSDGKRWDTSDVFYLLSYHYKKVLLIRLLEVYLLKKFKKIYKQSYQ